MLLLRGIRHGFFHFWLISRCDQAGDCNSFGSGMRTVQNSNTRWNSKHKGGWREEHTSFIPSWREDHLRHPLFFLIASVTFIFVQTWNNQNSKRMLDLAESLWAVSPTNDDPRMKSIISISMLFAIVMLLDTQKIRGRHIRNHKFGEHRRLLPTTLISPFFQCGWF